MPDTTINSSYAGGDDDGAPGHYDSTGRLVLESHQRAQVNSWGEVLRNFNRRADAKTMYAWYFPTGGYDANRMPVGPFKAAVWVGAHWESTHHNGLHKHWSVETPDPAGALQTRFEVVFGDQAVGDSIAGLTKTRILTNLADFVVRTTNGQVFRLATAAGAEKVIEFANDAAGAAPRWRIRQTAEAETGAGAGSNLQIVRYDDAGAAVDSPVTVDRKTGKTTLGGGLDVSRATGNTAQLYPQGAAHGELVTGLATTVRAYQATVAGDAVYRVAVFADGRIEWGSGLAARDTALFRSAPGVLKTEGTFHVGGGVLRLDDVVTPPTTGPALFVDGGALKYVGAAGTVTTIAPT